MKLILLLITGFISFAHTSQAKTPHLYKISSGETVSYILGTTHLGASLDDISTEDLKLMKNVTSIYSENSFELIKSIAQSWRDGYDKLSCSDDSKKIFNTQQIAQLQKLGFNTLAINCLSLKSLENLNVYFNARYSDKKYQKMMFMEEQIIEQVKVLRPSLKIKTLADNDFTELSCSSESCVKEKQNSRFFTEPEDSADYNLFSVADIINTDTADQINAMNDLIRTDYLSEKIPDDYDFQSDDDLLLLSKNNSWKEKLSPLLKKDSILIIVGLRHLYSNKGLIKLLEDDGFEISPVTILNPLK